MNLDAMIDELADRIAARLAARQSPDTTYATEDEAIALIGSKEKTKRLLKSGAVRGAVVGRRLVVERASLYAFIESQRVTPTEKPETHADKVNEALKRAGLKVMAGGRG